MRWRKQYLSYRSSWYRWIHPWVETSPEPSPPKVHTSPDCSLQGWWLSLWSGRIGGWARRLVDKEGSWKEASLSLNPPPLLVRSEKKNYLFKLLNLYLPLDWSGAWQPSRWGSQCGWHRWGRQRSHRGKRSWTHCTARRKTEWLFDQSGLVSRWYLKQSHIFLTSWISLFLPISLI